MALVLVGKTGLYQFQNMEEARLWMDNHLDSTEGVVIIPQSGEASDFLDYLEDTAPIIIEET